MQTKKIVVFHKRLDLRIVANFLCAKIPAALGHYGGDLLATGFACHITQTL